MPLKLYYPTKPYQCFQKFGGCLPSVCSIYKGLGLEGHNGEDLYAPDGWIVRAAHDGHVVFAGEDGSAGLGVVIRTHTPHPYGTGEAYFKSIYWHLKTNSIVVGVNQDVRVGDVIALADNTGQSTGSHLHFGIKPVYQGENSWTWWNAEQENGYKGAIDPKPYWTGICAEDAYRPRISNTLDFGDEGGAVRALQTVLQRLGFFPSKQAVTGFFGKITLDSVKAYQRNRGIISWGTPATTGYGRVGPKTRDRLNAEA